MLTIEKTYITGWEPAIRGMRNPMNSWDKSDSDFGCEAATGSYDICNECDVCDESCRKEKVYVVGPADHDLMMKLAGNGPVHAKYRRMLIVYADITAPFYWWKEFDTYKVGTVANSCSTMHKIHSKAFETSDFSTEHLTYNSMCTLENTIVELNYYQQMYMDADNMLKLETDEVAKGVLVEQRKNAWWQLIQLLPTSYNQKRTVMMNYEVLHNIYVSRKDHKLDEWRVGFIDWIKSLPYSELITGDEEKVW